MSHRHLKMAYRVPGAVLDSENRSANETGNVFSFRAFSPPFFLKINIRSLERGLLHPWDFPDKSTGVRCHCLLPYFHCLFVILSSQLDPTALQGKDLVHHIVCHVPVT